MKVSEIQFSLRNFLKEIETLPPISKHIYKHRIWNIWRIFRDKQLLLFSAHLPEGFWREPSCVQQRTS